MAGCSFPIIVVEQKGPRVWNGGPLSLWQCFSIHTHYSNGRLVQRPFDAVGGLHRSRLHSASTPLHSDCLTLQQPLPSALPSLIQTLYKWRREFFQMTVCVCECTHALLIDIKIYENGWFGYLRQKEWSERYGWRGQRGIRGRQRAMRTEVKGLQDKSYYH